MRSWITCAAIVAAILAGIIVNASEAIQATAEVLW